MGYLDNIKVPADIRNLSVEQLIELAAEVRQEIISTVSKTGGHLASSLGAVELTVALHYVFDFSIDKIVWDVSHQTYGYKILTGRRDRMNTIRQYGGLSGFCRREESEYDHYGTGHASTSISAALGFAVARDHAGQSHKVVAVIGDGSMTGGLAFEGLNNAGHLKKDMLVVLNDNTWSISKNVGAISKYLTSIMADEKFNKLRNEIWELTGRFKRRDKIRETIANIENSIKGLLVPGMLFQRLGFRYFGPIDGHDVPLLVKTIQDLKNLPGPIMLHIATVKGKGYEPAEENAFKYHGVGKFDKVTGEFSSVTSGRPAYTDVFGDTMLELAAKDDKVVGVTAAMAAGTGLVAFSEKYPERFFDVGIAEGHAGCFAAGLAMEKMKPYVAIYSTFMQRAYDQVIHDIALQKLPVVICMDRGGLVGNDGPTHHGSFDLSFLSAVPNLVVAAPKDGNELRAMLHYTADNDLPGPVAIRYPREIVPTDMKSEIETIAWGEWECENLKGDKFIFAVGTMYSSALEAAGLLSELGIDISVVNARFVKPLDCDMLDKIREQATLVVTVEENQLRGGFGQAVADYLLSSGYTGKFKALGLPDEFITHGNRELLLADLKLDVAGIVESIQGMAEKGGGEGLIHKLFGRKNGHSAKKAAGDTEIHLTSNERKSD